MLEFKSPEDLSKLPPDDPVFPIAKTWSNSSSPITSPRVMNTPEDDGWIVVIEENDKDRVLSEIWSDWTLLDIPWEGITLRDGYFTAVFLANDQFGIVFIIPDAEWIDGELRKMIEDHLDRRLSQ